MGYRTSDGTKGWKGSGIDREDGQAWIVKQLDNAATKAAGFETDGGATSKSRPDCDYEASGSVSKAAKSATGNFNPDYGKGKPGSKSCDGF